MKLYARLSALGVAAVFSTAVASATTYQFGSYATGQSNMGNANTAIVFDTFNSTPNPGVIYTPNTVAVDPGGIWHAALPNSTWVSFGQTGPTTPAFAQPGGNFAANGDYFFTSTFTLDTQATFFSFSVLADDTVGVFVDGQTQNALIKPSGGTNTTCNNDLPNCLEVDTVTSNDAPFDLSLLTPGLHTITFDVKQIKSQALGFDVSATIITGSPVPEPSSLFLLGTGLIGTAGALFGRTRAARR